jgi:hypothetical protein
VQLETEGPEPLGNGSLESFGLLLAVAVGNNVICLCRRPDYADVR